MDELSWSEEELIQAAEQIVDEEHVSVSHQVDLYHYYKFDVKFLGNTGGALLMGSALLSQMDVEGWLELPKHVGVVGMTGISISSLCMALDSVRKARRIRADLVE